MRKFKIDGEEWQLQDQECELCSNKVKELRQRRGWAQEDLARKIGVSLSTVQRWEKKGGEPTRLARRELKKLFQAAGIDDMTEET